ncbi:MAG: Conjugal transfer protein [Candidatus Magnetoglobus multicellularis str. Araruama]|uniref:Conjugal transfer protein n=1 Tax=Candidatus Magnetoglobus multicellularis str. Araruama TaxID=890399 RepID=A0A1V1PGI7_9BACT|nr:MAG: Conjugal transfer protein [Candidatus Magnetoglobus multicellularis str. Araruama]
MYPVTHRMFIWPKKEYVFPATRIQPDDASQMDQLPIPQQAMPEPTQQRPEPSQKKHKTGKVISPFRIIETANKRAALRPTEDSWINAVTVYDYIEGALYQVYCSPLHITDIMLQPGEKLTESPAAGDTVRWIIAVTSSGSGNKKRVHILLKPVTDGLHTNLVVTTSRRVYHLQIHSSKNKNQAQAGISWRYPKDSLASTQEFIANQDLDDENYQVNVDVKNLNFQYTIDGEARWKPIRVFDDAKKTYIQFPDRISVGELPPLFVISHEDKPQIVNYRFKNNFYIVDRIFYKALLQIGQKKPRKVYIINNKY